jgi:hypothetical protein
VSASWALRQPRARYPTRSLGFTLRRTSVARRRRCGNALSLHHGRHMQTHDDESRLDAVRVTAQSSDSSHSTDAPPRDVTIVLDGWKLLVGLTALAATCGLAFAIGSNVARSARSAGDAGMGSRRGPEALLAPHGHELDVPDETVPAPCGDGGRDGVPELRTVRHGSGWHCCYEYVVIPTREDNTSVEFNAWLAPMGKPGFGVGWVPGCPADRRWNTLTVHHSGWVPHERTVSRA